MALNSWHELVQEGHPIGYEHHHTLLPSYAEDEAEIVDSEEVVEEEKANVLLAIVIGFQVTHMGEVDKVWKPLRELCERRVVGNEQHEWS